jgi:hypothetical protein
MATHADLALRTALAELAGQYLAAPPSEVLQLFPNWQTELPLTICQLSKEEMRGVIAGLEENLSVGSFFARSALQSALDCYDFFGGEAGSQGGMLPPPSPTLFENYRSGQEGEHLIRRLLTEAPAAVAHVFTDFASQLRAASSWRTGELLAAVARLEATHADVSTRLFTEESWHQHQRMAMEAQALGFGVRAMRMVAQAKSAVAITEAVTTAVARAAAAASSCSSLGGSSANQSSIACYAGRAARPSSSDPASSTCDSILRRGELAASAAAAAAAAADAPATTLLHQRVASSILGQGTSRTFDPLRQVTSTRDVLPMYKGDSTLRPSVPQHHVPRHSFNAVHAPAADAAAASLDDDDDDEEEEATVQGRPAAYFSISTL